MAEEELEEPLYVRPPEVVKYEKTRELFGAQMDKDDLILREMHLEKLVKNLRQLVMIATEAETRGNATGNWVLTWKENGREITRVSPNEIANTAFAWRRQLRQAEAELDALRGKVDDTPTVQYFDLWEGVRG